MYTDVLRWVCFFSAAENDEQQSSAALLRNIEMQET